MEAALELFVMAGIGALLRNTASRPVQRQSGSDNRYYFWNDGTIRNAPQNAQGIGQEIKKDGKHRNQSA